MKELSVSVTQSDRLQRPISPVIPVLPWGCTGEGFETARKVELILVPQLARDLLERYPREREPFAGLMHPEQMQVLARPRASLFLEDNGEVRRR